MMKKRFLVVLVFLFVLAGCHNGTRYDALSGKSGKALSNFQEEFSSDEIHAAIAYLGSCDGTYERILEYWASLDGELLEEYPWLSELPESNFITGEGSELYAVIPAGEGITVTVSDFLAEDGDTSIRYSSDDGMPVVLRGNISDILPSFRVTVSFDSSEIECRPSLSLQNGRLNLEDGFHDFTPYDAIPQDQNRVYGELTGVWYAEAAGASGEALLAVLRIQPDGSASYSYGTLDGVLIQAYMGTWNTPDGALTLELSGGPVSDDSSKGAPAVSRVLSFSYEVTEDSLRLLSVMGGDLISGVSATEYVLSRIPG